MKQNPSKVKGGDCAGHRKRLRFRYDTGGYFSFLDYEKIEMLLTYVMRRRDVKQQAKALLKRFSTIGGILHASKEELLSVEGIGESAYYLLDLMRNLYGEYLYEELQKKDIIHNADDVLNYAKLRLDNLKKEAFLVLYLNSRSEAEACELFSCGTIDEIYVHPREIIEGALRHKARSVIIFHNHPSGEVTPSEEDIRFTEAVREAGRAVRVELLDHIVVTHNVCFSISGQSRIPIRSDFEFGKAAAEEASPVRKQVRARVSNDPLRFVHLAGIVREPGDTEYEEKEGEKK